MNKERKSRGQRDYERSVANKPTYHDGTPRKQWHQLHWYVQANWEQGDALVPQPQEATP